MLDLDRNLFLVDEIIRGHSARGGTWQCMSLLALRCAVNDDWTIAPDLWRVFHSPVEQVMLHRNNILYYIARLI